MSLYGTGGGGWWWCVYYLESQSLAARAGSNFIRWKPLSEAFSFSQKVSHLFNKEERRKVYSGPWLPPPLSCTVEAKLPISHYSQGGSIVRIQRVTVKCRAELFHVRKLLPTHHYPCLFTTRGRCLRDCCKSLFALKNE